MGHEEEIGTNNFCLVELGHLLRISIYAFSTVLIASPSF